MTVHDRIIKILKDNNINYERTEHVHVHTSFEAAKVRNLEVSTGLKALIFFANKSPILVVVPGDKRVNTGLFKKAFGFRNLKFASAEQVFDTIGIEIGSVPPLGKVLNLKSYFDKSVENNEKVAFSAGLHTVSIIMNCRDLLSLEKPEMGDFAEKI
jgi:prolyl-tRNA editing enzyme YbaK/EbsC (Cys-tRNA(Pro) deacylase)